MSFGLLSNTVDDCSAISSLNLTKNPFDSATAGDGRLHLPALSASPSIFSQTNTPGSQKVRVEPVYLLEYLALHLVCCC